MGMLQDNKSRKKISNDPNNTKWTRDTTTFGQKILRSQGWQPGQFLGAQDSPHAALHSAASASYIRVVLKDDMKGLGFDRAKEDEVTGLDVFSDVLSRLNGKSDAAVQEDQDARLAIKTHRYVEMRWGPMRFVRGGLLVGDKLKEVAVVEGSGDSSSTEATRSKKDKKSKKRKAEEGQDDSEAAAKKEKKEKKRRRKDGDEDDEAEKKNKKRRKEDKDKTEKKAKKASKLKDGSDDSDDDKESDDKAARKRAKKEKKEGKRERREKKEEKKRRKAAVESSSSDDDDDDNDASRSATVTPATRSGTSTPLGNRNFVRSRYIAQKRQAVMDATALKQIFMVKA